MPRKPAAATASPPASRTRRAKPAAAAAPKTAKPVKGMTAGGARAAVKAAAKALAQPPARKPAAKKPAAKKAVQKVEQKAAQKPEQKAAQKPEQKPVRKPIAPAPAMERTPAETLRPVLVRDSFTMPQQEYAVLQDVKQACLRAGIDVKKSELLRIGVALLGQLDVTTLQAVLAALPQLKTGRPPSGA